jgi:pimeloyl-ACP methyl ester carboxylesterase
MAGEETFRTRVDPVLVTMPDRCRIAARAYGPEDAPPVLFVAGGDGGMLQWRGLIPELCVDAGELESFAEAGCTASLAADLRVAAFDGRGTGWSSRSHGVCATTAAAAADVLALAAALFGRRFHLVGHGLGGAAALQVALAGARLVSSLTLISSTAGGEAMTPPGQTFFEVRATLADALEALEDDGDSAGVGVDLEELAGFVRRDVELGFTPGFVAAHPGLIDRLAAEALHDLVGELELARHGASGTTAAAGRGEQFATHDVAGRLDEVAAPTLVVCGSEDVVLPPGNAQALAGRIPGARLVTLEAGHMVTIERAADVAASVRAHVLMHP